MTDQVSVYSVIVSREDDLWVAVVPTIPAAATDVERFEELPDAVRDLISTLLDVEPDSFWIDWKYRLGGRDLTCVIEQLREWEELAQRAARQRDASRRTAVESMRSAGLSYREIADVIGLSHQRVGQLLSHFGADSTLKDPEHTSMTKWTRPVRNVIFHGNSTKGESSPLETVLIALLDSVRRISPDARHDLLFSMASVLEAAAKDKDFLRSH